MNNQTSKTNKMTLQDQAKIVDIIKAVASIMAVVILFGAALKIDINSVKDDVGNNTDDIIEIKSEAKYIIKEMKENHKDVMNGLHSIELQMKDKLDRE